MTVSKKQFLQIFPADRFTDKPEVVGIYALRVLRLPCQIQNVGVLEYYFSAVFFDRIPESFKEQGLIRFRNHNMIAMGAAERNVFIRVHFPSPMEIMFLEVHKTVVLSVIVFETAMGIKDFRFEIPIVYFLNLSTN